MAHVLPQVAIHRIIQEGMVILRQDTTILDDIFAYYLCDEMVAAYGQGYIDNIKTWLTQTKIPVVQAWSLNTQTAPQVSIRLAAESEDESKAAIGDYWGAEDEIGNVGVATFTVQLDIGLHASKGSDEVLWLYYIVNYILFKRKRRAEALGLQLYTFSATDHSRDMMKMADNIFTRTIRLRTTVENFWVAEGVTNLDDLTVDLDAEDMPGNNTVDI